MKQTENYNQKLRIPDKLFTPQNGVRLTGGLFRRVFDDNVTFNLTQLNMDRMRYWFDVKAGRAPKGIRYSGHFEDNLKGQTASQYLMCAGNALRWEENEALRAGMNEVLDFLEDSQEIDGFLMPIDKADFAHREYPHYVRIWLTYGLLAAGRAGEKRAYRMMRLFQDWFNRCPDLPVIKYLELAFQGVVASPLVYLSPIGVEDDMRISREVYEEDWRLGQFLHNEEWAVCTRKQPGREPHPHGSELEAFEGYLDLYRWTGAPYYLNAVKNVILQYRRDWQYPGGGIIMCERFGAAQGHRVLYDSKEQRYNEMCTSVFWMGIHQRLHRLYPEDESHVFEIEQSLYNVVFALQNSSVDIRSFATLDERVREPIRPNSCCSGTGTMAMAKLPEYLFSMNGSLLSCDIFAPAELTWERESGNVTVKEITDYPFDGKVSFAFDMASPHDFAVQVRIPCYAAAESIPVLLNGEKIAEGIPGSYVKIERLWQSGDSLSLDIPFGWRMHGYVGEHDVEGYRRCAFTYGPLLYALRGPRTHPNGIPVTGDPEDFTARLTPNGIPMHYSVDGMDGYDMIPYYEIMPNEHFVCFPLFSKEK